MPYWRFRIGDVFEASDPLAVWMATLSAAINDAVHSIPSTSGPPPAVRHGRSSTNGESPSATSPRRACTLSRAGQSQRWWRFLREQTLQERFDEVINRYEDVRALAHRVRNQAAFHYAYEGGAEAVAAALTRMADDDGWFGGGEDERLRGGRWHYADDLLADFVYDAAGGGEDAYADAAARVAEGVAAFARFANAALDAYFVSHANSVRQQEPVPKHVTEGG